jgi:PAS domain
MPFGPTSIQSIRSPNQRELVAQWQRLSASRLFPEITEFVPPERETKQLMLWDVENDGATRRFRMRRQGERLTETVAANLTGKTMDEVVPEPLRTPALAAANECVESRCAVYEIITTIDANAHVVECERLLLPFGRDGKVGCLIAALQLISYQGTVDRTTVANEFGAHPELGFVGLIPASARDGAAIVLPPRYQVQRVEPAAARVEAPASVGADAGVDKRRAKRRVVRKTGRIQARGISEVCTVRDISVSGASLDVVNAARVPNHFTLVMEMESAARSCAVVWRKERQLGVEFR